MRICHNHSDYGDYMPLQQLQATTWSTASRAIPCLRAAGGNSINHIDYGDYMVDNLPRDSLSEGRGW
jgi:hypothetical protein